MILGNNRAIKVGQWYANEIAASVDMNFIGTSTYENFVDQVALAFTQGINSGRNLVVGGLGLDWNNLLTVDFRAGAAISPKGGYLSGAIWGFVASEGESFLAIVSEDQSFAFDSGGANDRIDTVEIRPIETDYNALPRKFKDPITEDVTESLTNTRREYDYDVQIRKGDDSAALAVEQSDFTFLDASPAFGGNYLTFETAFGAYYIWWDEDGGDVDPAPSGRTGIEIDLEVAVHTTAELVATKTETDLLAADIRGISVSRVTVVLSIDTTTYGDYTDATIGTVDISDLTVSVTDGNGATEETAGWIKIAEVAVGNGASAITQNDIVGYDSSHLWNNNALGTIPAMASHDPDIRWNSGRNYATDDIVLYSGTLYASSTDDNIGNIPSAGAPWDGTVTVNGELTAGTLAAATINTGQGANEVHAMNQDVETTDDVVFNTVNTGQGANELYAMNQDVETSDDVVFNTVNTGQGANELYDMDQNVLVASDVQFASLEIAKRPLASGSSNVYSATNPTRNDVFDALSAVIPGTGDFISMNGYGVADIDVGGTERIQVISIVAAKRETSTRIVFAVLNWTWDTATFTRSLDIFSTSATWLADNGDTSNYFLTGGSILGGGVLILSW